MLFKKRLGVNLVKKVRLIFVFSATLLKTRNFIIHLDIIQTFDIVPFPVIFRK